jgi:transcriptional regulator
MLVSPSTQHIVTTVFNDFMGISDTKWGNDAATRPPCGLGRNSPVRRNRCAVERHLSVTPPLRFGLVRRAVADGVQGTSVAIRAAVGLRTVRIVSVVGGCHFFRSTGSMFRASFHEDDPAVIHQIIREARLPTLVTATSPGLLATPLPLFLVEEQSESVLYGHIAKANPHWTFPPTGEALAIFAGPDAYISPSSYPSKREHGKVVPTWNYVAVHAYGPVEFFDEEQRLYEVVTTLTRHHEAARAMPWAVTDAPADFIRSQLRAIVGIRLTISRIEGKRKLSQNRPLADREGVASALSQSDREQDRILAAMMCGSGRRHRTSLAQCDDRTTTSDPLAFCNVP